MLREHGELADIASNAVEHHTQSECMHSERERVLMAIVETELF